MSEEKDGFQIIDEEEVELMLDLLQNTTPAYGYKEKHRKAVRLMEEKLGQIKWQRRQDEAHEFLIEWRTEKMGERNHDVR